MTTDKVKRQLKNVPELLARSTHSGATCTLNFSNFSVNHVMEVFWCGYDGTLERKATLVTGQSHRVEGNTGQVWVLVAIQREIESAIEYQKSLSDQEKLVPSSSELLLVQVHRPLISTLFGYTGMQTPTI